MRFGFFFLLCALSGVHVSHAGRGKRYYDILDVSEDADEATLKRAYKRQAMKWHPDRNPTNQEEANKKFMEIGEAYEILSDPEKRSQYDRFGESAFQTGGGGGGGFHGGGQRFHFGNAERMFRWVFEEDEGGGGGSGFNFGFGGGGFNFGGGQQRRRQPPPEEDFYKDDPYVQSLTEQNFDEDVYGWIRLVEFYAPWCGHCRTLSPKWSALGKAMQGVLKVTAVNCDKFGKLCQKHDIDGYPTIRAFFSGGDPEGLDYEGDRTTRDLQKWALSLIPNYVVSIEKPYQLDAFLEGCKSKGKASWHVCVLLFTEKESTSALYKSLSFMFEGKILLGEIQGHAPSLSQRFNVSAYPSLIAVCNGNIKTLEPFQKKMQPDRIRTFLNSFAGGKKCNRAILIDSEKDIEALSASQLREILREHGTVCEGCVEKGDYIKRVKEILAQ